MGRLLEDFQQFRYLGRAAEHDRAVRLKHVQHRRVIRLRQSQFHRALTVNDMIHTGHFKRFHGFEIYFAPDRILVEYRDHRALFEQRPDFTGQNVLVRIVFGVHAGFLHRFRTSFAPQHRFRSRPRVSGFRDFIDDGPIVIRFPGFLHVDPSVSNADDVRRVTSATNGFNRTVQHDARVDYT